MATKVNLMLGALLAIVAAALYTTELEAPRADPDALELAALEDGVARDRADAGLARALADHYLERGEARLAVAVLAVAAPSVREDPAVLHRLARAYEETGRVRDAAATAELAMARCARALGAEGASTLTPPPAHRCSEGTFASLAIHARALVQLREWGVTDVRNDPRADRAYGLATRSARILSASAE